MKGRRGIIWDTLLWWIIGVAVLVFAVILVAVLSGKGSGALDYIKNMLRFRG